MDDDFDDFQMATPAWRIPKLRARIREAYAAGAQGLPLVEGLYGGDAHRALQQAWRRGNWWWARIRPDEREWTLRLALVAGRKWPARSIPQRRTGPIFLSEYRRLWPQMNGVIRAFGKAFHPSRHKRARLVAIACNMQRSLPKSRKRQIFAEINAMGGAVDPKGYLPERSCITSAQGDSHIQEAAATLRSN